MRIYHFSSEEKLYSKLALHLWEKLKLRGAKRWGLATGKTMEPLYAKLVEFQQAWPISLDNLETFNLDEYVGPDFSDKRSFHYYMKSQLFDHLGLKTSQTHLLNGSATDISAEISRFDEKLLAAKLDLQLLGLGLNGHVGFNEPGSTLFSRTRLVNLSESTIKQNNLQGINQALTMGIGSIMQAKCLYLIITGIKKANIFRDFILDEHCHLPASFLKEHPKLFIFLDQSVLTSLSLLEREKLAPFIFDGDDTLGPI